MARVLFGAQPPPGEAPDRISDATAAASLLAARYIDPAGELIPDNPTTAAGVVTLAVRVYQDPASPAGSLASDAYSGVYVPEDLLTHVRHYFDPWRVRGMGLA